MKLNSLFEKIGPGPIITAAFIGPGTVTVCTLAGISFDFTLLWALLLSVVATIYLQEISGRIGLVTGKDLSQLIRSQEENKLVKGITMVLILTAIGLGNAAYQGGNISGANMGLGTIWEAPVWDLGKIQLQSGNLIFGILAFVLLWSGNFKWIERILVALVLVMSVSFIVTAILTKPDFRQLLTGFIPSFSAEKMPTIVALIGTTVVPYNLFLYASLVNQRWKKQGDIHLMRRDISLSVVLGGLVSMAILVVGVSNPSDSLQSAQDIAKGLNGIFGNWATYLMGFGLLAAGLTSSLTAPLAGGLVICGILGWSQDIKSQSMRAVMGGILILGIGFSSFGIRPVTLITLAQLANGALLPIISGWLIWKARDQKLLGKEANTWTQSLIGMIIWLVTLGLGIRSIVTVLGLG